MGVPDVVSQTDVPTWLEALRSPAATIAALGLSVRLIVWPAILTLLRRDLKPELSMLTDHDRRIPALEQDMGNIRADLSELRGVPSTLARIEEQLKAMRDERRMIS